MTSCSGEMGCRAGCAWGRAEDPPAGLGEGPAEHLLRLLLPRLLEQGIHSDVVFVVHGKPFRAHRCVLGARSAYFANMLDTKWKGKNVVVLRHPLVCPSQGQVEGQQGAYAGWLPLTFPPGLPACRSTPWPLGPCCSTCTQVNL